MGLESDKQRKEFAATSKLPSNISDVKFAKVCKLRSIGVFHTPDRTDSDHVYPIMSGGDARLLDGESGEDVLFRANKGCPRQSEVQVNGCVCTRVEIVQLFDTLLALKIAYLKLQEALIPYDPDKVRGADEEVMFQLDTLVKIKKAYKEKILKEANSASACSAFFLAEGQVKERALEKLKSQNKSKSKKVANLLKKLQELERKNQKLKEEVEVRERGRFAGGFKAIFLGECYQGSWKSYS